VKRVVGIARRPFDPAEHGWAKLEYRRGDVRDADALADAFAGADVVVHLAFIITGNAPRETIRAVNVEGTLNTFRAAAEAGAPLVMAGHALYPALDSRRIASQSPAVLGTLLRERLGFRGAVVTDSMEAEAVISRSSVPEAAVRSLAAGCDLLLLTGRGSFLPVQRRLEAEARRSPRFRARLEQAGARVLALRRRLGLPPTPR